MKDERSRRHIRIGPAITTSQAAVPERPTLATPSAQADTSKALVSAGSIAQNTTVSANGTSAGSNATVPQMSNSLNSTNDPSKCHKDLPNDELANVFCFPPDGEQLYFDTDYDGTFPLFTCL